MVRVLGDLKGHRQRPGRAIGQRAVFRYHGHVGRAHEAAQRREHAPGEQLEIAQLGLVEGPGGPIGQLRGQSGRGWADSCASELMFLTTYASVPSGTRHCGGPDANDTDGSHGRLATAVTVSTAQAQTALASAYAGQRPTPRPRPRG